MKRIKYSKIDVLKQNYLNVFSGDPKLQGKWCDLRKEVVALGGTERFYPEDFSDLLIADFNLLSDLFFDYKEIAIPDETRVGLCNVFNYSRWQSKIAAFFVNHAKDLDINTCFYCETSYINTYTAISRKKIQFDIDHFLPKSKCPIVSLSLFNMIPCCPICNQRLKGSKLLGNNPQESRLLSPSSDLYSFSEQVHFYVLPLKIGNNLRFQDTPDNYKIVMVSSLPVYNKEKEMFHLDERYSFHKCEALRLLDLMRDYPPAHIKLIHNALSTQGAFYAESKIKEDIFGEEFIVNNHRALGKLRHDIMKLYEDK